MNRWYDPGCFPAPAAFTYGNAGRNILYGPGIDNVDFAVHRFFAIPAREGMKLEFRAELFNLFNRTEFSMPEVSLGLPQTGQITVFSQDVELIAIQCRRTAWPVALIIIHLRP